MYGPAVRCKWFRRAGGERSCINVSGLCGEGAGLGLAIVQDVLNAYGWSLDLAKSELGDLKATVAPSAAK